MEVQFRFEGGDVLARQLNRLDEEANEHLVYAVDDALKRVQDDAESRAPVGPFSRPPHLADNIERRVERVSRRVVRGVVAPTREVFYGRFFEFGFVDRGGNHHPARPWLSVAFTENTDAMVGDVIRTLRRRVGLL